MKANERNRLKKRSSQLLDKSDQLKEELKELRDKRAAISETAPLVPEETWRTVTYSLESGSMMHTAPSWEFTPAEYQAIDEYGKVKAQIVEKEQLLSCVNDTLASLRKPQQEQRIAECLDYLADRFIGSDDLLFQRASKLYDRFEAAYEKGLFQPDIPPDIIPLGGRPRNPHILKEAYDQASREEPAPPSSVQQPGEHRLPEHLKNWEDKEAYPLGHTHKDTASILNRSVKTVWNYVNKRTPPLLHEHDDGNITIESIKTLLKKP